MGVKMCQRPSDHCLCVSGAFENGTILVWELRNPSAVYLEINTQQKDPCKKRARLFCVAGSSSDSYHHPPLQYFVLNSILFKLVAFVDRQAQIL
jgi:hypothetical protein